MTLKKLARVVRVRKWYVISFALVGAVVGYLVASGINEGRQPQYEATASIQFGSAEATNERDRDPAVEEDLAKALAAAEAANRDVIEGGLGRVISNSQTGELLFSARSREESTAVERAEGMRSAYLESTTEGSAEDRRQRLEEIVTEASGILAQLNELDRPSVETEEPDPEIDPAVTARLDLLNSLVAGLTQQHTSLEIDLILARAGDDRVGDPEEIQSELDAVSERLDEIFAEIAQISADNDLTSSQVTGRQNGIEETPETSADPRTTVVPAEAQSPEEVERQWTIDALQSRYEELAAEYESLYIEDREAIPAELTAAQVADLTPSRAPYRVYTVLGLLLGAIVASALAIGEAALSGRIYVLSDTTPLSGLAEIPAAHSLMAGRPGLHVESASPRRVDGIHRLRIALLGMQGSNAPNPVIALTRVGVDPLEAGMLATDLARRLAASGRSILVLDVDFGVDSRYPVPASSTSVADLISKARVDPEAAATQMKQAFAEVISTESFRLIRSGQLKEDPADILLTDAFWMLLEVAREQSDIVLIVTSEAAHRSTFSLQQRVNGQIAVCAVGKTRREALLKLATPTVAASVGVVLLTEQRPLRLRSLARVGRSIIRASRSMRDRLNWRRPTGDSSEPGA